ncbi:N-fatty-acyl-amino acid synthase/hydrolase PM20D1-like [Galendromus occidentalis]|uniref:N-fatty-acyl-amino acid synthase/hydrolase PM20D1-like n=1 Tax=Galendromus occidentalis TaxID=34638 RepID=A0AAJ7WIV6_9ACAR|nr:N-fatty-acyl-amino acid synthase/hydrolase PM20D1-like [Galendromus occidentalis]
MTAFALYLAFRTALLKANVKFPSDRALEKNFPITISQALAGALRFETISYDQSSSKNFNQTAFTGLKKFIFKQYPKIFRKPPEWILHRMIAEHSILLHVYGQDLKLKPYMLSAHLDVVPVDEKLWSHPPFAGYTDDLHVWGRGALDDKHRVMAILEALNLRIERKHRPMRSFFIAFGHDQEVHGLAGAKTIAKYLNTIKSKVEFILDEGPPILKDAIPGVEEPVALIGVAEKGYLTVKVKCVDEARHASIPSHETAITTLSRALSRFTSTAHAAQMTKLLEALVEEIAPYAKFPYDIAYSNMWLFKPLVSRFFSSSDVVSAQMRTTSAVTVIHGGSKENVIPNKAEALVNHQILPGYTIRDVLAADRELIKDIPNVSVDIYKMDSKPTRASPFGKDAFGYNQIKRAVKKIFPEAIVAPSLMVANTDTKHYLQANLTENVYRFSPVLLSLADISSIHGNDEKISKINFRRLADFYLQLLYNCDESIPRELKHYRSDL